MEKQIGVFHIVLKIIYPNVEDAQNYETDYGVRYVVETLSNIIQTKHEIIADLLPGTNSTLKWFNENAPAVSTLQL